MKNLVNTGVMNLNNPFDNSLKVVNIITIIAITIHIFYFCTFLVFQFLYSGFYFLNSIANIVFICLLFFVFWFTGKRMKVAAGLYIFINGCIPSVGFTILFFGVYFGTHYYLLAFPAILLLIFNQKADYKYFIFLSVVSIMLFAYCHYLPCKPLIPILRHPREFKFLNIINILAPLLMSLYVLYIFSLNLNKARDELDVLHSRANELLLNILPEPIANRLKNKEKNIADSFSEATILFADFKEFTSFTSKRSPKQIVKILNRYFTAYDQLCDKYGVEKIKTIGDAYMAATGIPIATHDHAYKMANFACDMMLVTKEISEKEGTPLELRIGINSGIVVAGVIGQKKFIYDLWGDAVNLASRMESQGIAGQIQTTKATYELLKDSFNFKKRGVIKIKGKEPQEVYLLIGKKK